GAADGAKEARGVPRRALPEALDGAHPGTEALDRGLAGQPNRDFARGPDAEPEVEGRAELTSDPEGAAQRSRHDATVVRGTAAVAGKPPLAHHTVFFEKVVTQYDVNIIMARTDGLRIGKGDAQRIAEAIGGTLPLAQVFRAPEGGTCRVRFRSRGEYGKACCCGQFAAFARGHRIAAGDVVRFSKSDAGDFVITLDKGSGSSGESQRGCPTPGPSNDVGAAVRPGAGALRLPAAARWRRDSGLGRGQEGHKAAWDGGDPAQKVALAAPSAAGTSGPDLRVWRRGDDNSRGVSSHDGAPASQAIRWERTRWKTWGGALGREATLWIARTITRVTTGSWGAQAR
ncbi:hypothetical protein KFL_013450010, partial [Klebsormidium nitens]